MDAATIDAASAAASLNISLNGLQGLLKRGILRRHGGRYFTSSDVQQAGQWLDDLRWLAVVTPENWAALNEAGLTVTAIPASRKWAGEYMRPGNRILFYATEASKFVGEARVVKHPQSRRILIRATPYPTRVELEPIVALPLADGLDIRPMIPNLTFIRNKSRWGFSFRSAVRIIPMDDYEEVTQELARYNRSRVP